MFYLVGVLRTSGPADNISSNPEKMAPRRQWGEPGYTDILKQRASSWEHQKIDPYANPC